MTDHPKNAFSENGKPNFRDKDNAEPNLKPAFSSKPAPNLAPPGSVGIRTVRYEVISKREPEPQTKQVESIVKTHERPEYLSGGRFTDKPDYGFAIEVNPFRSFAGIEGGKINALEIQQQGKIVAQYQNLQWTMKPKDQEHIDLVQRLQDQFGEKPKDFKAIVPIIPLDRDHDR